MNWLYYLAEANIYLGVFYVAYCLFLNKETYYQLNRAYLLFSCIVSFILPVLQIGSLKPVETAAIATVNYTIPVQTTFNTVAAPVIVEKSLTLQDYLWYAYLLGAAILLLILIIKLYTLVKLVRSAQRVKQDKHKLIYLPETDVAFSFFNYLFIGTNAHGANTIIRHELVHINQKHSFDIIFLELLKIVNWFNPCIYLLQNSLKTVHEYIADEQTAAYEPDALTYSSFLVNNAYGAGGSSITHSFFNYNLLKKRIIMLNQQRSGNLARLKYLLAIPVCAGLLCASTLAFSKTYGWVDLAPAEKSLNNVTVAPFSDTLTTSKGYKYKESAYLVKGKENFRILIYEKNRIEKAYFRNNATQAELKLLKDKYGYTFPTMKVYDGPPPPTPSFTKPGYEGLQHHIMKTISYHPADYERGSFVVIGFNVAGNHKLIDAKIVKSGGSKFDAITLNAFKTYNLAMPVKSGNYKIVVLFNNNQESTDAYAALGNDPSGVGLWSISNFTYKTMRTSKGYEYDEYAQTSEEVGAKTFYRVVIYEKNGDVKSFMSTPISAATITLLKNKYGYIFPKGSVPPPPPLAPSVRKSKTPPITGAIIPNQSTDFTDLYKYIVKQTRYPAEARENNVEARTYATFNVDQNHKINNIKMAAGPSEALSNEVARVLQNYGTLSIAKTGKTYILPVCFIIPDNPNRGPYERTKNYKINSLSGVTEDNRVTLDEVVVTGAPFKIR
jgi:hypothetical protein